MNPFRGTRPALLALSFALIFLSTAPLGAQIVMSPNQFTLDSTAVVCGGPCRIVDISESALVLGTASGAGAGEDVDLSILDAESTLSTTDSSLYFDANMADLTLGSGSLAQPGDDGDLLLGDGAGSILIDLDGATGNIFQDVDNVDVTNGNGAVKAWAKIFPNGTIDSCWRCNPDTGETRLLAAGLYEIDFLVGDISERPCVVSPGAHTATNNADRNVECYDSTDTSSKSVEANDLASNSANGAFTIIIY